MKKLILISMTLALTTMGCVKGDPGPQGPAGPAGSNGAGGSATASRIVKTINCAGTVTGLTGYAGSSLNGLEIEYDVAVMSSGDVYATGNVSDENHQVSATSFYAAGQNGASDAAVFITADYDATRDGGFWDISVNRQTLVTRAVYTDASLGGSVTMTFNASACKVSNW